MKNKLIRVALLAALAALVATPVLAEAGEHQLRARLIYIMPDDGLDGTLQELANDGQTLEVQDDFTLELDYTYFFSDSWGLEIIAAFPTQGVDFAIEGEGDFSFGGIRHAPLTFLGQYHFMPDGNFQPYVGLGINWTIFLDEYGILLSQLAEPDSSSFGFAAQLGADFKIGDDWYFNIDLKYINIETDITLTEDGKDFFGTSEADFGSVEINPFVLGFGVGYRF